MKKKAPDRPFIILNNPTVRPASGQVNDFVNTENSYYRRGFLQGGTLLVSLLSIFGLSKIVNAFLSLGQRETQATRYRVGHWDEFQLGDVIKKQGVYLVRDDKGLFALHGDCPHLRCGFRWNAEIELFECPCHGSRFERTGRYVSGPAKKPLQHVSLTTNSNGEIIADTLQSVPEDFRLTGG